MAEVVRRRMCVYRLTAQQLVASNHLCLVKCFANWQRFAMVRVSVHRKRDHLFALAETLSQRVSVACAGRIFCQWVANTAIQRRREAAAVNERLRGSTAELASAVSATAARESVIRCASQCLVVLCRTVEPEDIVARQLRRLLVPSFSHSGSFTAADVESTIEWVNRVAQRILSGLQLSRPLVRTVHEQLVQLRHALSGLRADFVHRLRSNEALIGIVASTAMKQLEHADRIVKESTDLSHQIDFLSSRLRVSEASNQQHKLHVVELSALQDEANSLVLSNTLQEGTISGLKKTISRLTDDNHLLKLQQSTVFNHQSDVFDRNRDVLAQRSRDEHRAVVAASQLTSDAIRSVVGQDQWNAVRSAAYDISSIHQKLEQTVATLCQAHEMVEDSTFPHSDMGMKIDPAALAAYRRIAGKSSKELERCRDSLRTVLGRIPDLVVSSSSLVPSTRSRSSRSIAPSPSPAPPF